MRQKFSLVLFPQHINIEALSNINFLEVLEVQKYRDNGNSLWSRIFHSLLVRLKEFCSHSQVGLRQIKKL